MKMKSILLLLAMMLGWTQTMRADEPFRKHRYDSWKVLTLPQNAIVFAGNSITDMHVWTEAFGNDPRVVNRGNSGGYSYEVLDNVESWVRYQPAKVFIKIGTNDLGTDFDEYSIARNIQKTVNIIRRESPGTEIYLQSILPAYDQKYKTAQTIRATNVLIKAIADQTEHTTYIDLNSKMGGILNGQPYSLDNLHLMAYGYKIWTEAIKEYVGIEPCYPANTQSIQNALGLTGSHGMRATYFSVLPTTQQDILFFGDEMVKNGEWNELLHNPHVKNRGSWWGYGGNIATVSKYVDAAFANSAKGVLRERPAKMLLYTGTEDINGSTDMATVQNSYKALVNKLKTNAPGTPLALVSLMPTQNANARITTFNTWLKAQADADADLTYVDIYSALATSTGVANTKYFVGNYIYGMGYMQVARKLAEFIGDCTVDSDADAQRNKDLFEARATLNSAISALDDVTVGNALGQYPESAVNAVRTKADAAMSLLQGNEASLAELQSAATAINTELTKMKQSLNPLSAANTQGRQFTLSTPNRSNRYAYADGSGVKCAGSNAGFASYRWVFESRTDGTYNIRNAGTGTYVNSATGHNQQLQLSSTAPTKGWTLSYSDAMGLYIIRSTTPAEFNMSNSSTMIVYNWHNTSDATNRSDTGCQWLVQDVTDVEVTPDPVPDNTAWEGNADWYTMQIAAAGLYVHNNGTENKIVLDRATTEYADCDLWMREGSNAEGYLLYNKECGPNKVLAAPSDASANTGGNTYPVMVDKDKVPAGYVARWMFTPSSDLGDTEAWYVYEKGYPNNKLNNRSNVLAFWTGGADAGSSIQWRWAQRTMQVNTSTGTFTAMNGNGTWAKTWTSNATKPTLILDAGHNNMSVANSNATTIQAFRGTSEPETYTLSAGESGYFVSGYSMDFVMSGSTAITVKDANDKSYTSSKTVQTITCKGLQEGEAKFTLSGSNNGIDITNMRVTIQATPEAELGVRVFDNSVSPVPYRIPAVAKNRQGDLIFVTDYRYSGADIGMATNGKLDLRVRTLSADSVWSEVKTLAACITTGKFTAFGDPCIVADRTSDRVMVTSCCGNVSFPGGTHENHQGWARFYSEDGGKTWGKHTDISQQVFDQLDKRSDGPIRCFFIGSGKISQSSRVKVGDYYRVYCAALVKAGDGTNCNYVFYSDDFGENWNLLGTPDDCPIPSGGDEPKADELPDGSILISSRVTGGRYYNVYHFTNTKKGEGKWGTMTFSGSGNKGVTAQGNSCNGEIMVVPVVRKADGQKTYLLLQSVPFGNGRTNVGIYYKELTNLSKYRTGADVAPNWDGKYQVTRKDAAYSTMCMDKDNNLAFFYEELGYNGGYNMIYRKLSIEEITGGKYVYSEMTNKERKAYLKAGLHSYVETLNIQDEKIVGMPDMAAVETSAAAYEADPEDEAYEVFNDALANSGTKLDATGKAAYYLKNVGRSSASVSYAMTYANATFECANTATATNTERNWMQFIPVEGEEDTYYLYNPRMKRYFGRIGANETVATPVTNVASAGKFKVEIKGMGQCALNNVNHTGSNAYLHLAGDCKRIVPWSATEASLWYVVEAVEDYDVYTAIENLTPAQTRVGTLYDLQGRPATQGTGHGIYVRGRKKVVL